MSYAGHVIDMLIRARNNSALLLSKKIRFRRLKEAHANAKAKKSLYENDKKLTKEAWQVYKQELRLKLKQGRKNEIYLAGLLLIIIILVGGFFVWLLFLTNF